MYIDLDFYIFLRVFYHYVIIYLAAFFSLDAVLALQQHLFSGTHVKK